jgi:hypothetical protein
MAIAILAWPSDALAWGPLAHLSFSAQALATTGPIPEALRSLLGEHGNEFLYGSLAADLVVGKSMARFVHHAHNWKVGFDVLEHARPGPERAVAWGFLAHLAADTVAHNYFVPWKRVASFERARAGHAYWELRYDQRLDPGLSQLARQVETGATRFYDHFLARDLRQGSVLPFPLTRQLFRSLVLSAKLRPFQEVSRLALAPEWGQPLEDDLLEEANELAVLAILELMLEGRRSEAAGADATGERNLAVADRLRRRLAQEVRRGLPVEEARELAAESRPAFRRAILGTLVLPPRVARLAA